MDFEGGNPVSALGVGDKVSLVTVDFGRQPKSEVKALTIKWPSGRVFWRLLINKTTTYMVFCQKLDSANAIAFLYRFIQFKKYAFVFLFVFPSCPPPPSPSPPLTFLYYLIHAYHFYLDFG